MDERIFSYPPSFLHAMWENFIHTRSDKREDIISYLRRMMTVHHTGGYYWSSMWSNGEAFQETILQHFPHETIQPILQRFPFPHLWDRIIKKKKPYFVSFHYYGRYLDMVRDEIGCILLRLEPLRQFKKLLITFHKSAKKGTLILRNRKDKLPDIRVHIRYHPQADPYFESAFSGRFMGDIEDGCFVIHTKREGTNQEVMQIYWDAFRKDRKRGKEEVYAYLERNKDTVEALTAAVDSIYSVSKYDMRGGFVGLVGTYINDYVGKTLYNKGLTCTDRLYQFVTLDPVLAEYIWSVNFDTEKKRFALAGDLEIANRLQKKFLQSENVSMLKSIIEQKKVVIQKLKSTIYDKLPQSIWNKIQNAEKALEDAKLGTPVGFRGVRYINSEEIEHAQFKLKQAWIEADRYIGKHRSS